MIPSTSKRRTAAQRTHFDMTREQEPLRSQAADPSSDIGLGSGRGGRRPIRIFLYIRETGRAAPLGSSAYGIGLGYLGRTRYEFGIADMCDRSPRPACVNFA